MKKLYRKIRTKKTIKRLYRNKTKKAIQKWASYDVPFLIKKAIQKLFYFFAYKSLKNKHSCAMLQISKSVLLRTKKGRNKHD